MIITILERICSHTASYGYIMNMLHCNYVKRFLMIFLNLIGDSEYLISVGIVFNVRLINLTSSMLVTIPQFSFRRISSLFKF